MGDYLGTLGIVAGKMYREYKKEYDNAEGYACFLGSCFMLMHRVGVNCNNYSHCWHHFKTVRIKFVYLFLYTYI